MIFVGLEQGARLRGRVLFAQVISKSYFVDLNAHPKWLVVFVVTLVLALIIWIMMKLLKWALWLLFFGVLIGGMLWSAYLLVH